MSTAADIQRLGLPCSDSAAGFYIFDSANTNLSTGGTSTTINATVAASFDGSFPVVREGWCMVEIQGLNSTPAINGVDIAIFDGTTTISVARFQPPTALVSAQGLNWLFPLFCTLSDTFLGIKTVTAIVSMNANATAGNCRVYFNGSV